MIDSQRSKSRPKVIILGAGFAGLNAAKTLGSAHVDVTIIDRNNHHTFHSLCKETRDAGQQSDFAYDGLPGVLFRYGGCRYDNPPATSVESG
jgi:NADH dehydrogenase